MTGRNACRGNLILVLAVLVALAGFQPGLAEDQDFKQLREAAEQGEAKAQYNLGVMYYKGDGVPQHYGEAAKWFLQAAEQGHAEAQYNLGVMYRDGQGLPRKFVNAHVLFNLAAAQGDKKASKDRDRLAARMTRERVAEAQQLSVELFNRIESDASDPHMERLLKESGVTTTSPALLSRVEPVYSEQARKAKLEGTVELSAIVRNDGSIGAVKVVRGLELELDENAVKAIKSWRFRPGTNDGIPVDMDLDIEVHFSLR